jgi:glycosyltransferase involved in cell wall biosynthesis
VGPQPKTQRRRVCLVIDHLGMGGAQRQMIELAKRLPPEHWQPVVVSLSTEKTVFASELRAAGIPCHLIDQRGAADWRCLFRLTRLMRRMKPAVVHTWLFTADTYGRLAARACGIRRVVCAMRNTIDDLPWHYRLVNRFLSRSTAIVTINAEAIREGLVRAGGIPDQKIRTIHNGITLDSDEPSGSQSLPEGWPAGGGNGVVGMVARLSPQKDHRTLLEAASQIQSEMPQASWVLIGDGPQRAAIEGWIRDLGLQERVVMLGQRENARALMARMSVFVLSTHYEGCSNAVMEAMAAGVPVVATDVGGNRELIAHEQTGFLVPPRDAQALAQAVLKLLRDPAMAQGMGQRARARMKNEFSMESAACKTQSLYKELMGEA